MTKNKDKTRELAQLNEQLQRVRQLSLAASRNDDFRAVARLTREAARLNHLIMAAEGAPVPALARLTDTLFTSADESRPIARPVRSLVAA